jgi:hypothetical protein
MLQRDPDPAGALDGEEQGHDQRQADGAGERPRDHQDAAEGVESGSESVEPEALPAPDLEGVDQLCHASEEQ